jgi:hypothetical protein
MPGLVPGIHVFELLRKRRDGRDIRAVTPVFDGPCPAVAEKRTRKA